MPYSIELFLDERTEALIKAVWEKLAIKGAADSLAKRGPRPHVSLAEFGDVDPGEATFLLRQMAKEQAPFEARFEVLGTDCSDDGILFLVPVVSPKFFLLHSTVMRSVGPVVQGLKENCKPNRYVPHCIIANGLTKETLGKAVALFSNKALPIVGNFNRIGLFDQESTQDRCVYPFQKI